MVFCAENYMKLAIEWAKINNPIWPFSAVIVDQNGKILCQATDCAHISPLFHAESLALHMLIQNQKKFSDPFANLTLITTAEPDVLSQSAIFWANVVHELDIQNIYYGSTLTTIRNIWSFGIDIPAKEIVARSSTADIKFHSQILESECNNLFQEAKSKQETINTEHPAMTIMSNNVEDFYIVNSKR